MKKKIVIIILSIVGGLAVLGGGVAAAWHFGLLDALKEPLTAFQTGTAINGVDVSDMTPEEAKQALEAQGEGYTFTLNMLDNSYTLTGEELELAIDPELDLAPLLDEQSRDRDKLVFTLEGPLFVADTAALMEQVKPDFSPQETVTLVPVEPEAEDAGETGETPEEAPAQEDAQTGEDGITVEYEEVITMVDPYAPQDAYIIYDSQTGGYVTVEDVPGLKVDFEDVSRQALAAIVALEPELTLDMDPYVVEAAITADSKEITDAMEQANQRLELQLSYTFTPDGGETSTYTFTPEVLSTLYYLDPETNAMKVNEELLGNLVNELGDTYNGPSRGTPFVTTGGRTINISIATAGQSVDTDALYEDMLTALNEGLEGTRVAPYAQKTESTSGYWGGNYVEIDLTRQHMWVYKHGECVLSCDVVSGNVANNTRTPTGVFTIKSKQRDRYLRGNNIDGTRYESWVSYFMPFSGGCGLHDATWRAYFGGTEYVFNGSHGCVGMTLANAKILFNNVSVGTHVVIYGGISHAQLPTREPMIDFAQSEYYVEVGQTIDLGITTDSTGKQWLSVSASGVVSVESNHTVKGLAEGTVVVGCYLDADETFKNGHRNAIIHVVPAGSLAAAQNISATVTPSAVTAGSTAQITVAGNQSAPQYTSGNTAVATVDASGKITAVAPGTATITVTCPAVSGQYKEGTTTVTVTVTAPCSHSWDAGTVTTPPTCTAEGVRTYTCGSCGGTKTEAIPATGHSWDAGTVTTPPTCGAEGVKTFTCGSCGGTKTEPVPATGSHTFTGGTSQATCDNCTAANPDYIAPTP